MTFRIPPAATSRVASTPQTERAQTPTRPVESQSASERMKDRMETFKTIKAPVKQLIGDFSLPQTSGGQRTTEDALSDMDALLLGPETSTQANGATVVRDAPNVHDPRDTRNPVSLGGLKGKGLDIDLGPFKPKTESRKEAAEAQLEANAALEQEHLAKLSPEERAQYEAVKEACLAEGDPVAALSLQKLLFQGKLPGEEALVGGGTLLDQLAAAADPNTPMVEGLDRGAFLCDLVQEIATPSAINQGSVGTCAPTTLAIDLAMRNPAEYARIALGLASPEGKVELAGGQTLEREPGTVMDDGKGRSNVQRLMGSAFMEMANGDRNYDNATEEGDGAWSNDLDVLYEALWGRPMSDKRLRTDEERAAAMDIIDTQLEAGRNVPVALSWGDGYHKVLVTGTEVVDGQEYVTYINPWGREERMPREEFESRLADINYDPMAQLKRIAESITGKKSPRETPPPPFSQGTVDADQLRRLAQLRG
ncbi:hypothetical protein [Hyalangium rubrum]|uniref:Calpain catalytic domain-containing protein n=1 Tax=Hyalangium rubrum TaxID=3103134 RepID=A0ABU5GVH7_9BACT|nr:hypothetical protein [Hyalangium sp. s54d21]MDY7225086.1 hypothetical protein [Hyalangium sp. s54d21]